MKFKTRLLALLLIFVLTLSLLASCGKVTIGDILNGLPTIGDNGSSSVPDDGSVELPLDPVVPDTPSTPDDQPAPPETPDDKPATPDTPDVPDFTNDPYVNVSASEFYADYSPAVCYMDAYWRSRHNFMSGTIDEQDQAPTISKYQPKQGNLYVRNTTCLFADNGNTYIVLDAYGNEAFRVYRGGAYIMLEEVAAYVFAFGTVPANHSTSKNTEPTESVWGIYLRVNNTKFSGDTDKYPYEPVLPNISGCGGSFQYYEMDIGTTGTDCDPKYDAVVYNDGYTITRGAARIVYAQYDRNGNRTLEPNERYLFYTYNHYNDFQEYLNYEGGWGEMFGNITGGGTISSKYDYNPTPYVSTARADFAAQAVAFNVTEIVAILPESIAVIFAERETIY